MFDKPTTEEKQLLPPSMHDRLRPARHFARRTPERLASPVGAGSYSRPPSDDHEPHGAAASPSWTDPQMMKTPRPAPSKPYGTRSSPAATRRGRRPRRPAATVNADPTASHQPCRGRRPRRPAATVSASLTTFRRPLPRRGIISQYITWRTARFPPAVGVGVIDDPFFRPSRTSPRSSNPS